MEENKMLKLIKGRKKCRIQKYKQIIRVTEKTVTNMVVRYLISIITLYIKGLNTPIERYRLSEWI